MKDNGYITIKENGRNEFVVNAKLIDGNLWLTKHEIADLFNVYVSTVNNNLKIIFNSGLLQEQDVTRIHSFECNGQSCETTLYNLEALICISYRIASFEAQAFRQWIMKGFQEYEGNRKSNVPKIWAIFCNTQNMPFTPLLN